MSEPKSKSTMKTATTVSIANALQILFFCISWYWTSSINAIASQRLLSSSKNANQDEKEEPSANCSYEIAILLTSLQLVVGALVAWLVLFINGISGSTQMKASLVSPISVMKNLVVNSNTQEGSSNSQHYFMFITGLLHYTGSLCTNIGFGYGSASLVQIIKLLEPFETLILSALAYYIRHGTVDKTIVSFNKIVGTGVIVIGTSMLLTQKSLDVNMTSVVFALLSGICLASRNVIKKQQQASISQHQPQPEQQNGNDTKYSSNKTSSFQHSFINGVLDFANITIMSVIPAILSTILFLVYNHFIHNNNTNATAKLLAILQLLNDRKGNFIRAIIFHCSYNLSSITVLSLTSAPLHSLLNVGKRIVNVVTASVVFGSPLSSLGKVGIVLAGIGGCLYKDYSPLFLVKKFCFSSPSKQEGTSTSSSSSSSGVQRRSLKRRVTFAGIALVLLFFQYAFVLRSATRSGDGERDDGFSVPVLHSSSNFVIWMYPFPPPPSTFLSEEQLWSLSSDEVLICPYKSACTKDRGQQSINLAELTKGSKFHNYVLDHTYQKFRHLGEQFLHNIQAITMITLMKKRAGTCVRSLGSTSKFCNEYFFEDYNPYQEENGKSTLLNTQFPFEILQSNETNITAGNDAMPLAPDMRTESFATYGPPYSSPCPPCIVDDESKYPSGRYNSGEDIQSMAGVGFYPFLSSVRPKGNPFENYTGYFIINSLQSGGGNNMPFPQFSDPMQRREFMRKTELLSIFYGEPKVIDKALDFYQEYTEHVFPFGARSTLTNSIMRKKRIKSYYSACLTLLSTYEGGVLSMDEKGLNPSLNAFPILEPSENTSIAIQELRESKELILMVDVIEPKAVPEEVRKRARHLSADIPRGYPRDAILHSPVEKYKYCYRLLSQYRNYAKVVITSRIHVGLPAAALGATVIFVSKGGWLPGGHERSGRVAGLLDIFHRVDQSKGMEWQWGNLTEPIYPNLDGTHLADRYRASFWNRLRRHNYYADAARVFGRLPLQRLGKALLYQHVQELFHFVIEPSDLQDWRSRRAVEAVFYFHPNAKVYLHLRTPSRDLGIFDIFVETGYNLEVITFKPHSTEIDQIDGLSVSNIQLERFPIQLALLVWTHGGVLLSSRTYIRGKLSTDLNSGYSSDHNGDIVMMISEKGSTSILKRILSVEIVSHLTSEESHFRGNITGASWEISTLNAEETSKCQQDGAWKLPNQNTIAAAIDRTVVDTNITLDTECYRIIEEHCIYCDDIHWVYG